VGASEKKSLASGANQTTITVLSSPQPVTIPTELSRLRLSHLQELMVTLLKT